MYHCVSINEVFSVTDNSFEMTFCMRNPYTVYSIVIYA